MKKTFKIIFGLLLILIISIYIGGLFFFTNRYMPRTYINGRDFGLVKKNLNSKRPTRTFPETLNLKSSPRIRT